MTLSSKPDRIVEQLFEMAPSSVWQHPQDDIDIRKAHTDLKGSDPLTNNFSHKHNMIKPELIEC